MAKLRRRNTSAPGVLVMLVSMVFLRLLNWFGQDYKRVALLKTVRRALKSATFRAGVALKRFDPF